MPLCPHCLLPYGAADSSPTGFPIGCCSQCGHPYACAARCHAAARTGDDPPRVVSLDVWLDEPAVPRTRDDPTRDDLDPVDDELPV